ncbi:MAG: type II toxin-antitoxin system ParD family antitoxin [Alphaproteobacteria bacterium]|nr:type II toxin-antitoxin system ParD family antitoxin [Alphaproteobacteria bacterium]
MQIEKLSITLPGELARLVRDKVATGAYASNSEVIREALRLLKEQEAIKEQKMEWLKSELQKSIDDPRPSVDASDTFSKLEARFGKA